MRSEAGGGCELESWLLPTACLLPLPFPAVAALSEWERTSHNLTAGPEAQQSFEAFLPYLQRMMSAVGDPTLQQEVDLLEKLIALP